MNKCEEADKVCKDLGEMWKVAWIDVKKWYAVVIHRFSDIALTGLRAFVLGFYPLLAALVNCTEQLRLKGVFANWTSFAFLPVRTLHGLYQSLSWCR